MDDIVRDVESSLCIDERAVFAIGFSYGGWMVGSRRRCIMTKIDDYLAKLSADKRAALDELRATIRSIVPRAEECISYGMPAFRLDGDVVAGFQATAKGCSYYPFSGTTLLTLAADLRGYDKTKSALHFRPDKPLPAPLVRKLIRARIAETR